MSKFGFASRPSGLPVMLVGVLSLHTLVFAATVSTPVLSRSTGTYIASVSVTTSSSTPGATLRYTVNGSDPTAGSSVWPGSLTFTTTTSLKVRAYKSGSTESSVTSATYTIQIPAPTITPAGGTLTSSPNVTISSSVSGVTLRYTTNGSDPGASSVVYTGPFAVTISQTVKARAFKSGMADSPVASAPFTLQVSPPQISPNGGSYSTAQNVTISVPAGSTVRYTTNGTDPTAASTQYSAPVPITATTTLRARAFRTGWTDSSIVSATFTLQAVAPVIAPAGGTFTSSTQITMTTTTSGGTIRYTTNGTDPTNTSTQYSAPFTQSASGTVKARTFKTGISDSPVAVANFTLQAATPTFTPAPGTYSAALNVTMASSTPGVTIRYTTNGTDPTATSALYSAPVACTITQTFKARAFKGGLSDSAVASATYTLQPPAVSSVVFSPINSALTCNPGTGGGERIFPDARSASDTVERRTVRVSARLTRAEAGVAIYFRVFDLDDPSDIALRYTTKAGAARTSPATDLDSNGPRGDDNLADGTSTPVQGLLTPGSSTTDATGLATVVLTVSRQPGNNFAVSASTDSAYSIGLRLRTTDGSVIEDSAGTALPNSRAVRTGPLTVWRTLHVETDRMANVTSNVVTGIVRSVRPGTVTNTTDVTIDKIPAPGINRTDGLLNRFQNGRFRARSGTAFTSYFAVRGNTASTGTTDVITLTGALPATTVGQSYELEDDDYLNFTNGSAVPLPDTSRLAGLFASAYIDVQFDLANPNATATFRTNSNTNGNLTAEYAFDNMMAPSQTFWRAYVLGAFQGHETEDGDPGIEPGIDGKLRGATLGQADGIGQAGNGAHVFMEGLRDRDTTIAVEWETVTHEVGHVMGGEHPDLGLMAQTWNQEERSVNWTNISLRKFRAIQRR